MSSVVDEKPHGSLRSRAKFVRQTWGKRYPGSVSASSYVAAGAPVGCPFGLYVSGFGLNGRDVVLLIVSKPVSTPVLPIWFEIHTYGGGPVKTPRPPRPCVR